MHAEQKHLAELIHHAEILLHQLCLSSIISLHSADFCLLTLMHLSDHSAQSTDETVVHLIHERDLLLCECHVIYHLIQHHCESITLSVHSHQLLSQQLLSLSNSILNHLLKL